MQRKMRKLKDATGAPGYGVRKVAAQLQAAQSDVKSHAGCNVSTEHRRDAGNWPVAGGLRSV